MAFISLATNCSDCHDHWFEIPINQPTTVSECFCLLHQKSTTDVNWEIFSSTSSGDLTLWWIPDCLEIVVIDSKNDMKIHRPKL